MFSSLLSQALSRSQRCLALLALPLALALPAGASAQTLLTQLTDTTKVQTDQVQAELVAHAPEGVAPGKTVWLGLQLTHAPDWHTYWKNSGDSGQPTDLQWTLPEGVSAGPVQWPTPRKFPIGPLANYGYNGTVLLPVPLTVDPAFAGDAIDIKLYANWLVCRKECIPEEGNFSMRLPLNGRAAEHSLAFDGAFKAAPANVDATTSAARPQATALEVELAGLPEAWRDQPLEFFPETTGLIEPGSPWEQRWEGGLWHASVPLSPYRSDSPSSLPLVVALAQPAGEGPGSPGVRLEVPVQGAWPAVEALPAAVPDALTAALQANAAQAAASSANPNPVPLTLWAALLGALIGGMILNLMPCVFPVLAIKVLAFAQHADDRRAHRAAGLAYTAGVVLSCLALGGLLLGLRAAGEQLGWGFQLQSPSVVASLAVLFTLIGLNLAGLFEFGNVLPSAVATLQARNPTADAFLTGVLATAIASPCTAPFMGASLGLAIALPAWQALAVFGALGLGMALPYLAASWWPAIARALPRPGAWMNTFRQLMAFPMFATVVWLLWVLGQQTGIDGAATLLMFLVVLTLLVWTLGLPRGNGRRVLASLVLGGLVWLGWSLGPNVTRLAAPTDAATSIATSVEGLSWEPWTPQKQAALLAEGRPVFVDFTAAWCVTCQYNKRTTLSNGALLADLAARNVALLRADWTRRDPAVTTALAALGRNGVPVYVLLRQGAAPVVMSEVLSVDDVRGALATL
jgi:thiol:disulfide interchange protein/DsbC/DsbD-like thiol-disulfide interchange protein